MPQQPIEPIHPDAPSDRVRVAVTIERPPAESLANQDRGEKYDSLLANSTYWRDKILAWLQERGLADQVFDVGGPTAFNLLFLTTTPGVAKQLPEAPGVVAVAPAGEVSVGLYGTPSNAPHPKKAAGTGGGGAC
jgi:hypothetical protein